MSELASLEKARIAAGAAVDKVGLDLVALDVSKVVSFADVFLIVSGRSDRQVRAIADGIREAAAKLGAERPRVEGYDEGRWVLIDWNDVIVHVFQEDARDQYDLERLWSDAPRLDLGVATESARSVV